MKNNYPSKNELIKPIIWLWQKQLFNYQQQEKGQTLVIAFMLGVIVLGATILGVLKSTQSKTNVQVDEYTKKAIATAEQGVNQFTSDLNSNYRAYLNLTYDPNNGVNEWADPPDLAGNPVCAASTVDLDSNLIPQVDLGNGRSYEVKSYVYTPSNPPTNPPTGTGTLTVKGIEQTGTSNSQAQISIELNVSEFVPPATFPGIYGSELVAVDAATITSPPGGTEANVVCLECTSSLAPDCQNGEPSDAYLYDAVKKDDNGTVEGNVVLGDPELPPIPDVPTTNCADDATVDCFILLDPITSSDVNLPRPATQTPTGVSDRDLLGVDPLDSSTHRTFYYVLQKQTGGQQRSVHNQNVTVDSSTGAVRLYVTGNYEQGGTNSTSHNGTIEKFAIFGCTDNLHNLDIDGNGIGDNNCIDPPTYEDQTFAIGGGATNLNVFLYAPNAQAGINGASSAMDFNGVVWVRTWGKDGSIGIGSNSSNITVSIPDDAKQLLESEFGPTFENPGVITNRITSKGSWQRVEATP